MAEASSFLYAGDYAALLLLQPGPTLPLPAPGPGSLLPPGPGALASCTGLGIPTQNGDLIRFSLAVSGGPKTVLFGGRSLLTNGSLVKFGQSLVSNSLSAPTEAFVPAGPGCIIGAAANVVGGVGAATIMVLIDVGTTEGGVYTPYATLYQGLFTASGTAPSVFIAGGGGGGGGGSCPCIPTYQYQFIDGIQAPQGWQVNRTPAANTIERIVVVNMYAEFGATVGNRYLFTENVVVGAAPAFYTQTAQDLPANSVMTAQWNIEATSPVNPSDVRYGLIPADLWYSTEYQLQIGIGGFQSGDEIFDGWALIEIRT